MKQDGACLFCVPICDPSGVMSFEVASLIGQGTCEACQGNSDVVIAGVVVRDFVIFNVKILGVWWAKGVHGERVEPGLVVKGRVRIRRRVARRRFNFAASVLEIVAAFWGCFCCVSPLRCDRLVSFWLARWGACVSGCTSRQVGWRPIVLFALGSTQHLV